MTRRYSAYLLRRWTLADGRERVEVQALPSGETRRYDTLADAYEWVRCPDTTDAPCDAACSSQPATSE